MPDLDVIANKVLIQLNKITRSLRLSVPHFSQPDIHNHISRYEVISFSRPLLVGLVLFVEGTAAGFDLNP